MHEFLGAGHAGFPGLSRACVREGLAVGAELSPAAIEREALALLEDGPRRAALEARLAHHAMPNGLDVALDALAGLLPAGTR